MAMLRMASNQKVNFYFTSEIHNCLDLFSVPMAVKDPQVKYAITAFNSKWKYKLAGLVYAALGHFTLLFCRGNVQRLICTCTAIVLLIKLFVWLCSRYCHRHGLLKLPISPPMIPFIPFSNFSNCDSKSFLSMHILHAALFTSLALVKFPISKNACAYLY